MNFRKLTKFALVSVIACSSVTAAKAWDEGPAVGRWRSVFSYYQATGLATDQETFYCGTSSGFFTYNRTDQSLNAYSKATGMHDVGVSVVAHDIGSGYTLIGYDNSNIDIFKDGTFYGLPDIKISTILGDKTFQDAVANLGNVYLSTGIGLIVVNLEKQEVKETIPFFDGSIKASVTSCTFIGNEIYVATTVGVFKSNLDNPFLVNYLTWERLSETAFENIEGASGNLYVSSGNEVFSMNRTDGATALLLTTTFPVKNISAAQDGSLWVGETGDSWANGKASKLTAAGVVADAFQCFYPTQFCETADGVLWYSDEAPNAEYGGLRKRTGGNTTASFTPSGPIVNTFFDVSAYNGELWVAHGSMTPGWTPLFNYNMFSHYLNGDWTNYNALVNSLNEPYTSDIIRITKNQRNGSIYFAALLGGVVELKKDGTIANYKQDKLEAMIGVPNEYRGAGVAFDDDGTMWVSNFGAPYELKAMDVDGNWYKFHIPANTVRTAADIIIDDYGYKWFIAPAGGGLAIFDDNGTLANTGDDRSRFLRSGEGNGNMPDNFPLSIAKDKDGIIWVGTRNGIGIINCASDIFNTGECEAYLKPVTYEGQESANYLFAEQPVSAITVDGANRKWVGTNNGVWLLSEDAEEIIYRFTAENSPLPSNIIYRINIDPVNGDVYFSTENGLVVFRGTATEGAATNAEELLIYPNPVPPGFGGQIAIRGVVENADVRITDISGQLVYRTTAHGGQAVWNGSDYTGRRVQTGVYLVFVTNRDGTEKTTGKLIFNE